MKNINILEAYIKASLEDRLALERILGKETFKTIDYYEIVSFVGGSSGEILKATQFVQPFFGNEIWKINQIKRLADNQIFGIGDYIDLNNMGKAYLTEIQFEVAPADRGTRKLCFVTDHETLGKWWSLSKLKIAEKPLFKTDDDVEVYVGTEFYIVKANHKLDLSNGGEPFTASASTPKYEGETYFYNLENAERYIELARRLQAIKETIKINQYPCYKDLVTKILK